jgi:hypothetical protein
VAEEQHADRCRLWLQWQRIDWPMLQDPINGLGLTAVPVLTAIDEWGIVRLTRPNPDTFEQEFLNRAFPKPDSLPEIGPATPPNAESLLKQAREQPSAAASRAAGDAALLWGGAAGVERAIAAYGDAARLDPADGPSRFRLGVAYRMRYDSPARQPGDFQAALDAWGAALALDPNQYIWRRRIQQYGPRLEKPYAFYDWVPEARAAIRARGEEPVPLAAEPGGAELAAPLKALPPAAPAPEPDPEGKVTRDSDGFIHVESAVAPGRIAPGGACRLHLTLRVNAARQAHWNNEAEPLRIWLRLPAGWEAERQLLDVPNPRAATSQEPRETSVELRLPRDASPGLVILSGYALYNVCEGETGVCLFRRQDFRARLEVGPTQGELSRAPGR